MTKDIILVSTSFCLAVVCCLDEKAFTKKQLDNISKELVPRTIVIGYNIVNQVVRANSEKDVHFIMYLGGFSSTKHVE
jgi:hypothetical protein